MPSQEKDNKGTPAAIEDLVALVRPTLDATWLDGSREEESSEEGDQIMRAIKGVAHEPMSQQQWGIVRAMNQQAATAIHPMDDVDLPFDEALWDETAALFPNWSGLLAGLKARWDTWWQQQQQAFEAGFAAITQSQQAQWTARGQAAAIPFAFVAHVAPHLTREGTTFQLRVNQTYALQIALPAPYYVALLQLDEEPEQPPSLLFPTNETQSQALGPGATELLQLRFPEGGDARLVLLFSTQPFADIATRWPSAESGQPVWSEEEQMQAAESLLAQIDDWSPQLLLLNINP